MFGWKCGPAQLFRNFVRNANLKCISNYEFAESKAWVCSPLLRKQKMPAVELEEKNSQAADSGEDSNASAQNRLQEESIESRRDASDRSTPAQDANNGFENPYSHVAMAGAAIRELQSIAGKKDDEKMLISDASGKTAETTVKERRELLVAAIEKEFSVALKSADSVDQESVEKALILVNAQIPKASSQDEQLVLKQQSIALESLKHAPSAVRFAYAMYLAGNSQLEKAAMQMNEAATIDPEASKDKQFREFHQKLKDAISNQQEKLVDNSEYMLPLLTLNLADAQRRQGNNEAAEVSYKKAIEKADQLDPKIVAAEIKAVEKAIEEQKDNPEALKLLEEQRRAWVAVANSPALARLTYADFLLQQKRYDDAEKQLLAVQEKSPEFVKGEKQFAVMLELARTQGKSSTDSNPFAHMEKFQKSLQAGDIAQARKDLEAAQKAADSVDRTLAQQNKKVILEQMQQEKNPQTLEELKQLYNIYDAFDHAAAFVRMTQGRFELAAKNFNVARSHLDEANQIDPAFTSRSEVEFEKLIAASKEPSTWDKVLEVSKALLKELLADAAAIAAGAGAVLLTGWTGPAALAAGAVAGSVVYTAVKGLMGEEIHWYTPVWGAIDGASGALGALARTTLVNAGGKIVSKEIAEAAVLKSGGSVAALSGLEGVAMADTAKQVAATGLKAMGKDIGLWSRLASSIPFIGAGNAEYRAALAAYRALSYSNMAIHAGINLGTAATVSSVYRFAHEGANYYNGTHAKFGDFVKAYGTAVVKDSVTGMVMGGFADGYGDGIILAVATNGAKAAGSKPESAMQFMNNWMSGTSQDAAFGAVSWLLGVGANFSGRWNANIPGSFKSLYAPSAAIWSDAYYTNAYLKQTVVPVVNALNKPIGPEDILKRYQFAPGTPAFTLESIPMV